MALHDNEMYFEACSMNLALKKTLYDENDVTELVKKFDQRERFIDRGHV